VIKESLYAYNFVTKDKTIYDFDSYENLLEYNKVSPDDAFVYVENNLFTEYYPANYFTLFSSIDVSYRTLIYRN